MSDATDELKDSAIYKELLFAATVNRGLMFFGIPQIVVNNGKTIAKSDPKRGARMVKLYREELLIK